jgi:hypothetical protein
MLAYATTLLAVATIVFEVFVGFPRPPPEPYPFMNHSYQGGDD